MTRSTSPTDEIARLVAHQNPLADVRSPALEFAEEFERQRRLIAEIQQPAALANLAQSEHWADISATIRALHRATQPSAATTAKLISAAQHLASSDVFRDLQRVALAADRVLLPTVDSLQSFASQAAAAIRPVQAHADAIARQHSSLIDNLAALKVPWMLKDYPAVSVTGFARISRLRTLPQEIEPYAPSASEIYQDELGDPVPFDADDSPEERESAALDAGLNPELIAFPFSAYPSVLFAAGFEFRLEPLEPPATESGDRTGRFDAGHGELLYHVENRLRATVESKLRGIAGSAWIRTRVPGELRDEWKRRQQKDRDQARDVYPLIHYADLMHLETLICRNDNWIEAFAGVFRNKPDFQVTMRRLSPVRNAIAHNRPLLRTDRLTLVSEAHRLFSALGLEH